MIAKTTQKPPPPMVSPLGFWQLWARTILRLQSWTWDFHIPDEPKYVLIGAPHTSNWDLFFALWLMQAAGIRGHFVGKASLFRPPLGILMRAWGGVPVERITDEVLKMYELDERELFRRGNREAKDMWLKLALEEGGLGQRDVGVRFGHADGTTVSRRLAEIAAALASDRNLRRRYEDLRQRIANSKA